MRPTQSFEGLLRRQRKLGVLTACRYIDLLLPNVSAAGSAKDTPLHYGISGAPKLSSVHPHLARVQFTTAVAQEENVSSASRQKIARKETRALLRFVGRADLEQATVVRLIHSVIGHEQA